jgi:hypothetical protein
MAKLSIKLKIAGTTFSYPEIESSEEEVYRYAERKVNELFVKNADKALLPKDRLALAALGLAMENVKLRTGISTDADLDRLAQLDRQINDYLHRTEKK